jgi:hypothetical protein
MAVKGVKHMDELFKIAILDNEIEAQLMDSVLTERGIPHEMRSYHDTAYDGLFQTQKGWGYIGAPLAYREQVLEILDDLRNQAGRFALSDSDPSGGSPE